MKYIDCIALLTFLPPLGFVTHEPTLRILFTELPEFVAIP